MPLYSEGFCKIYTKSAQICITSIDSLQSVAISAFRKPVYTRPPAVQTGCNVTLRDGIGPRASLEHL